MGTHPIFESDFDCLTESFGLIRNKMNQKQETTTPMPLPPEIYYTKYTNKAIRNGAAPKPPKIPEGAVSVFGQPQCATWGTVRPIEEYDFPRLHSQLYDRRVELKKLVQSVAVAFLDLLQILSTAPESPLRTQRIDDISLLFIHILHMINEFRPHQARETLKLILEVQKKRRETISANLGKMIEKCRLIIEEAHSSLRNSI